MQFGLTAEWLVAIGAILGAILGSFLGTVAVRLPLGRSIVTGRSACDGCGRRLGAAELVPILSWAVQRGRCRGCGAAIGLGQLAAELGGALVGALAWWADDGRAIAALVLGWQLLLLALLDARSLWLPWRLTALLAVSGLGAALWQDHGAPGSMALVQAVLGGSLGYAILALVAWAYRRMRRREGLGGGDPLLLGAIGIWVGPIGAIHVLLGAALLGLTVAAVMVGRGKGREGALTAQTMLPLGTFMAIAAWPVYLFG